jgi:hypothetical protein
VAGRTEENCQNPVMEPVPGLFAGSPEHKPFTAVVVVVVVVVSGGFNSSSMFGRGNRLFYTN